MFNPMVGYQIGLVFVGGVTFGLGIPRKAAGSPSDLTWWGIALCAVAILWSVL
jgi:hypothetical protein